MVACRSLGRLSFAISKKRRVDDSVSVGDGPLTVGECKKDRAFKEGTMSSTSQPCGVDSTGIVKQSTIGSVRAQYGMVPLFWGRYFKGPGDIDPTDFQYKYKRENGVLESNGIKLLPIARQTSNVGGSERDGERDGKHNAAAIIEALGANYLTQSDVEPLVFLDTEPEGSGPALSFDYYVGWANGLIAEGLRQTANKVFFQPGVYLNSGGREGNGPKAARVIAKVAEHVANNQLDQRLLCRAVWAALYGDRTPVSPPPAWSDSQTRLPDLPSSCAVVAWQWAEAKDNIPRLPIDPNIINQACSSILLDHLLVPPRPSFWRRLFGGGS